jgi:hypothetical protein
MIVKLGFDSQFVGSWEDEFEIPDNSTEEYIKNMFPDKLGIKFNNECYYEIKRT